MMYKDLKADWTPPLEYFRVVVNRRVEYYYPTLWFYPIKGEIGSWGGIRWLATKS